MPCSSNCPTPGAHQSFGECVRSKGLQVASSEAHKHHKERYREVDAYRDARAAGLQPESIFKSDVDKAWRETERTGTPFRADQ